MTNYLETLVCLEMNCLVVLGLVVLGLLWKLNIAKLETAKWRNKVILEKKIKKGIKHHQEYMGPHKHDLYNEYYLNWISNMNLRCLIFVAALFVLHFGDTNTR